MIPKAVIKRIFQSVGADRVSNDALVLLEEFIVKEAESIAADSISVSSHSGRKTVKKDDVKLAISLAY